MSDRQVGSLGGRTSLHLIELVGKKRLMLLDMAVWGKKLWGKYHTNIEISDKIEALVGCY